MIYPDRYEKEPRKRKAYEVACDFIGIYGLPRKEFDYQQYGLNRVEMKEVWDRAEKDMQGKSMLCVCY